MRLPYVVLGLTAAGMLLSGCGGGGSASSASPTSNSPSGSGSGSGSGTSSPPASAGSATVSWAAPTTNTNGTALTDLAGFHIHYGTSSTSLMQEADVANPAAVSYAVSGLATGTWYFAVSAYTNSGLESGLSMVGSKTIT